MWTADRVRRVLSQAGPRRELYVGHNRSRWWITYPGTLRPEDRGPVPDEVVSEMRARGELVRAYPETHDALVLKDR